MDKIFRIFPKGQDTATAVGFLQSEDETTYTFRVQNGTKSTVKTFEKSSFKIQSILETASEETYQIKTTNAEGKKIIIELPKSCFGGCA